MTHAALEGTVALVTGGGRGLGAGIVMSLATAGADVAIADVNLADAQAIANEVTATGRRAIALHVDVTNWIQVRTMVQKTVAEFGALDIIVNAVCPGIAGTAMWLGRNGLAEKYKYPEETLEQSYARNLRTFIPQCVEQTAEDIGQAVVFLASAPHVTGQAINIDGGFNLF